VRQVRTEAAAVAEDTGSRRRCGKIGGGRFGESIVVEDDGGGTTAAIDALCEGRVEQAPCCTRKQASLASTGQRRTVGLAVPGVGSQTGVT